ncbi:MAG: hypothetical protein K2X87_27065 [Gemmataceae bacterium]|nr:hypothetical protein [Gemmataceae bacterium]
MDATDDILNDAHDAVLSAVRTRLGADLSWDETVDLTGAVMAIVIQAVAAAVRADRARRAAPNARLRRGSPAAPTNPTGPDHNGEAP